MSLNAGNDTVQYWADDGSEPRSMPHGAHNGRARRIVATDCQPPDGVCGKDTVSKTAEDSDRGGFVGTVDGGSYVAVPLLCLSDNELQGKVTSAEYGNGLSYPRNAGWSFVMLGENPD